MRKAAKGNDNSKNSGRSSSSESQVSSDLSQAPRSILKHHIKRKVVRRRRRRRRRVSFNSQNEIFVIPSRKQLQEEQRNERRRRRIKRKLTMRPRRMSAKIMSVRRKAGPRVRPKTRGVNRLARARKIYLKSKRRQSRSNAKVPASRKDTSKRTVSSVFGPVDGGSESGTNKQQPAAKSNNNNNNKRGQKGHRSRQTKGSK